MLGPTPAMIREGIARNGTIRLKVEGWSMFPMIPPGATVLLGPADSARLAAGSIVAVGKGDRTVCHRVVEVRADEIGPIFRTSGLTTPRADPPSRQAHLVGVVREIEYGPLTLGVGGREFEFASLFARLFGPAVGLALSVYRGIRSS